MALKGKPVAIGNTATTIYTCPATKEAAVHGLLFGNNTASALAVDVIVYNQATGSDITVVTDLAVPANGIATWSKPINLNAGDAVKAVSSAASGMVCLYSTYEDGATPVASGFTARGAWSAAATYVANDIVSVSGSGTYVAIQGSTNQDPTTATAYWMFLEGISASALPAQSGNAGKYLTTDGSTASWGEVDVTGGATRYTNRTADYQITTSDDKTLGFSFNSSGLAVKTPSATSLEKGFSYHIQNIGSNSFALNSYTGKSISSVNGGGSAILYLIDNTTVDGVWAVNLGALQGSYTLRTTINTGIANEESGSSIAHSHDDVVVVASLRSDGVVRVVATDFGTNPPTQGSIATLSLSATTYRYHVHLERLSDGLLTMKYAYYNGSVYHQYIIPISVSGTTVSLGSSTLVSNTADSNDTSDHFSGIERVDDTRGVVYWAWTNGSTWYQSFKVYSQSGTTVSLGNLVNYSNDGWVKAGVMVANNGSEIHAFNSGSATVAVGGTIYKYTLSGTTATSAGSYSIDTFGSITDRNTPLQGVKPLSGTDTIYYWSFGTVIARYDYSGGQWALTTTYAPSNYNEYEHDLISIDDTDDNSLGLFNNVSAGLQGAGYGFRQVSYDPTSQSFGTSGISLLVNGNVTWSGLYGFQYAYRKNVCVTSNGIICFQYVNTTDAEVAIGSLSTTLTG